MSSGYIPSSATAASLHEPSYDFHSAMRQASKIQVFHSDRNGFPVEVNYEGVFSKNKILQNIYKNAETRIVGSPSRSPSFSSLDLFNEQDILESKFKAELCGKALDKHKDKLSIEEQMGFLLKMLKTIKSSLRILAPSSFLLRSSSSAKDYVKNLLGKISEKAILHSLRIYGLPQTLRFIDDLVKIGSPSNELNDIYRSMGYFLVEHFAAEKDLSALNLLISHFSSYDSIAGYAKENKLKVLLAQGLLKPALEFLTQEQSCLSPAFKISFCFKLAEELLKHEDTLSLAFVLKIAQESLDLHNTPPAQRALHELNLARDSYLQAAKEVSILTEKFDVQNEALGLEDYTDEQEEQICQLMRSNGLAHKKRQIQEYSARYQSLSPCSYRDDLEIFQRKIDDFKASLSSTELSIVNEISKPLSPSRRACKLSIAFDAGWGNALEIRGNFKGASWEKGIEMHWSEGNLWSASFEAPKLGDEFKVVLVVNKGTDHERVVWESLSSNRRFSDTSGTITDISFS